jgi:hypothetical protein
MGGQQGLPAQPHHLPQISFGDVRAHEIAVVLMSSLRALRRCQCVLAYAKEAITSA